MDSRFDHMFCATTTMSKTQQKAQSTLWYAKLECTVRVQCEFRYELRSEPLDDKSIRKRYKQFRDGQCGKKALCWVA
jgi:hypothetical protein